MEVGGDFPHVIKNHSFRIALEMEERNGRYFTMGGIYQIEDIWRDVI